MYFSSSCTHQINYSYLLLKLNRFFLQNETGNVKQYSERCESTTCKAEGSFCPRLRLRYHNVYDKHTTKRTLAQNIAPNYGEWFDLTGTITFSDEEISMDNPFYSMYFDGPGKSNIFFI